MRRHRAGDGSRPDPSPRAAGAKAGRPACHVSPNSPSITAQMNVGATHGDSDIPPFASVSPSNHSGELAFGSGAPGRLTPTPARPPSPTRRARDQNRTARPRPRTTGSGWANCRPPTRNRRGDHTSGRWWARCAGRAASRNRAEPGDPIRPLHGPAGRRPTAPGTPYRR